MNDLSKGSSNDWNHHIQSAWTKWDFVLSILCDSEWYLKRQIQKYTKMRLKNMLKICLIFWKSETQYAYKRHAYKQPCINCLYVLAWAKIFKLDVKQKQRCEFNRDRGWRSVGFSSHRKYLSALFQENSNPINQC